MRSSIGTHTALSADETLQLGKTLGSALPKNTVIALFGDLGAGKTTFIRGLVEGIGSIDRRNVSSPTFTLLNIYEGSKTVYHFDLYRMESEEDFFNAGFDEYFNAGGICCLEWADKIGSKLPTDTIKVTISYLDEEKRQIEIS